jgi:hypothetical protein
LIATVQSAASTGGGVSGNNSTSTSSLSLQSWGILPDASSQNQYHQHHQNFDLTPRPLPNNSKVTTPITRNSDINGRKPAIGAEKKRNLEKLRRADINDKFSALIQVVKRIETEENGMERKRREEQQQQKLKEQQEREQKNDDDDDNNNNNGKKKEDGGIEGEGKEGELRVAVGTKEEHHHQRNGNDNSKNKKKRKVDMTTLPAESTAVIIATKEFKHRFPYFISPNNRADLIARTVSHLEWYSKIQNKQRTEMTNLREQLDKLKREEEESAQKLKDFEGDGNNKYANTMMSLAAYFYPTTTTLATATATATATGVDDSCTTDVQQKDQQLQQQQSPVS